MTSRMLIYRTLVKNKLSTIRFSGLDDHLNASDTIQNPAIQLTVEICEA